MAIFGMLVITNPQSVWNTLSDFPNRLTIFAKEEPTCSYGLLNYDNVKPEYKQAYLFLLHMRKYAECTLLISPDVVVTSSDYYSRIADKSILQANQLLEFENNDKTNTVFLSGKEFSNNGEIQVYVGKRKVNSVVITKNDRNHQISIDINDLNVSPNQVVITSRWQIEQERIGGSLSLIVYIFSIGTLILIIRDAIKRNILRYID